MIIAYIYRLCIGLWQCVVHMNALRSLRVKRLLLAITYPFLLSALTRAEVFDLENSSPWLTVGRSRVTFSSGWDAFVVADSSCVRINSRGVYAKPSHWKVRRLPAWAWSSVRCSPSGRGGLCDTGLGVAFPETRPLYNASGAWGGMQCTRKEDGRVLDSEYGYDVSACDVLDGGGDVVLCGRTLSYAKTGLVEPVYWVLCLISVFVVRSLSYLVVNKITACSEGSIEVTWVDWATIVACLAVLPLSLIPSGDSGFVTVEETLFYDFVCFYCGLYVILFMLHALACSLNDPPIYNLIAATLQLVACRLYLSAETPYNPVIIWAVSTRAMAKLRSRYWGGIIIGLSTLADAIILALMCMIAFSHNRFYIVAIMALSMATSDTLIEKRN
jgi:hypothetical protein